jgi:hypothetical protein
LPQTLKITDRLIALFLRKPEYFKYCISSHYPLTLEQIERYKDDLIWFDDSVAYANGRGLSTNQNLSWSKELLKKYADRWDWYNISSWIIGTCIWYDGILDDWANKISHDAISWNSDIPWDEELIAKYEDQINWNYLSHSGKMKWTPQMLDRFAHKIEWEQMSNNMNNPWTRGTSYSYLTYNDRFTIQETIDSLEKYEDRLDWSVMFLDWNNGLTREEADKLIDTVIRLIR